MLLRGGSAVDAAVAMAAVLVVTEPTGNGLGSDAFAVVADGGDIYGLNASGPSPLMLPAARWLDAGQMPRLGWPAVTVPGAVAAWEALHRRWGRLPWKEVLEPAMRYAEEGFPVAPETARAWKRAAVTYADLSGGEHAYFLKTFFPGGRAPAAGDIWRNPDLARSLRRIGDEGVRWFYKGDFADALERFSLATGGFLRASDLSGYAPEWTSPLRSSCNGAEVLELPPNGQGIATLLAINILRQLPLGDHPRESVPAYHLQIEAMKLAFADVRTHIGDPSAMRLPLDLLLDEEYARKRARLIGRDAMNIPVSGFPRGDTVYLAAASGEQSISYIQSNYMGFGAAVAVPGTGAALQNRGAGFVCDPRHPGRVAPGKRPYHTIMPGFLTRKGIPWGPFGLMGGFMQPQGHLQLALNMVLYDMNPQAALDAPRWQIAAGGTQLWLEQGVSQHIARGLADRGHPVQVFAEPAPFGKGQILLREEGVWWAASEPRADGQAQVC